MFEIFAVVGSILISFFVVFKSGESKGQRKVIDKMKDNTIKTVKESKKRKEKIKSLPKKDIKEKMKKWVR